MGDGYGGDNMKKTVTPLLWKEKGQKEKQRTTKHTHKTKDQVTRTPLITEGELSCSRRVSSSCSTSGTHRVYLVTNLMISHVVLNSGLDMVFIMQNVLK